LISARAVNCVYLRVGGVGKLFGRRQVKFSDNLHCTNWQLHLHQRTACDLWILFRLAKRWCKNQLFEERLESLEAYQELQLKRTQMLGYKTEVTLYVNIRLPGFWFGHFNAV